MPKEMIKQDGAKFFLEVVEKALEIPGVQINRDEFLSNQFSKTRYSDKIESILEYGPVAAGVAMNDIARLARGCINWEATKVTAISAAAGIPGGWAMAATIPADLAQFYAHVFRVMQKIMYLYGFADLNTVNEDFKSIMVIFLGIMFGVSGIEGAAAKLCQQLAAQVPKKIVKKKVAEMVIYRIVKKVAQWIGVKMTKDIFAKGVGKLIPVVGAVFSGGLTLATFKPMAIKLQNFLENECSNNTDHTDFDSEDQIIVLGELDDDTI